LQVHIGASEIIRRHTGGRIGIDTDHFRIPLLLCFAASAPRSGRFSKCSASLSRVISGKFLFKNCGLLKNQACLAMLHQLDWN
jgi:hypothetical protein